MKSKSGGTASLRRALLLMTLVSVHMALYVGPASAGPVQISEVRVDQPGQDDDEYFELSGTPSESIAGLTYLVIGDGTTVGGSGTIEEVTTLTGTLSVTGFFVVADTTFTLGTADLTADLNFENSDNVTHLLVSGFTGADGDDLDTNDDGVLDVTPWTSLVDAVAFLGGGTDQYYSLSTVSPGPDLSGSAGLGIRCFSVWRTGHFDPVQNHDTPGTTNLCDDTDPSSAIDFPEDEASYTSSAYDAGCGDSSSDLCGTAVDNVGGSGLIGVEVRLQRDSDSFFWNGGSWQMTEVWNPAQDTAAWSYSFDPAEGAYTLSARATDYQGNVESPATADFLIDNTPPQPKNVSLKSSAGAVEKGTRVTLTAAVSPCAGHRGDIIKFQKKVDGDWNTFATIDSNDDCRAKARPRIRRRTVFRATSPKQDADHLAGKSDPLTVRVRS